MTIFKRLISALALLCLTFIHLNSQEQLTHFEGIECCFNVVEMSEIDGELYVLATDYNGASRIYHKDQGKWEVKTKHSPYNGKRILQQGFQKAEDYFYILQKDSLKYYYPAEDQWEVYAIPGEEGVFVYESTQSSECRDDFFINQWGVSNWVMNEQWDWELVFRNVIDQEVITLFEEQIELEGYCWQMEMNESFIYYSSIYAEDNKRVLSHHIETGREDTLLNEAYAFKKVNGRVFIHNYYEGVYYTDGSSENTFKLATDIEDINFSNIEYRDGKWQLLVNSKDSVLHFMELDSKGLITAHDSIIINTSNTVFQTNIFQKTGFGKYAFNIGLDIYIYERDTRSLEKVGEIIYLDNYSIGYITIINNSLITFNEDFKMIKIDMITGDREVLERPSIHQLQKVEDKLMIISYLEDLSFQHSDGELSALYQYTLDDGLEELLHLDEYHYGLHKGELRVSGDRLFVLDDACHEYDLRNGFYRIPVPGKIQDIQMHKGSRYLLSSLDDIYNGYDSLVVFRQFTNFLYESSDILSNPIVDDPQFLDLSPSSNKLFIELRQYGYNFNSNYYDFDSYNIETLSPPGQSYSLSFISKLDNGTILCRRDYTYWSFDPENEEYQLLYTLPVNESYHDRNFVELKDHYLHFLSRGSGHKVISVNKLTFEMETIIEQNNDAYYVHETFFQCNDRILFVSGADPYRDSVWTTDGTAQRTDLINDQFNFTREPSHYGTHTYLPSPYFNFYHSADTALYYWDCASNGFNKVHPVPLKLDHVFSFENKDWLIADNEDGSYILLHATPGSALQVDDTLYSNQTFVPTEIRQDYWEYRNPYLTVDSIKMFFRDNLDDRGEELWEIHRDSGLTRVADINPGAYGSYPNNIRLFGDHIFFLAYTYGEGMQVWRMPLDSGGTTSTSPIPQHIEFTAAPNPTQNQIHLNDLPIENCEILLMDLSGKILQHILKPTGTIKYTVQLESYTPGPYFLKVINRNKEAGVIKIIKM